MTTAMETTASAGLITAAKPIIAEHEGERLHVYEDIYGIPTIGIGINLTLPLNQQVCRVGGADPQKLIGGTADLSPEQSLFLYQQAAIEVLSWLTALFPAFFTYSLNRQIALLDMGYNLGETRFRGFRQMISCILAGDWAEAAHQALSSQWAVQVGERAEQDATWLAVG